MDTVKAVFKFMHQQLEYAEAWVKPGGDPGCLLVEMFHGSLDVETETKLPQEFMSRESRVRCIVTTVAFGMGVQVPDVKYIMHWGPPDSLLSYWQEVGRCARDPELEGRAVLYVPPRTAVANRTNPDMLRMVREKMCLRKHILKSLQIKGISDQDIDACCGGKECCSYCRENVTENESGHIEV